MSAYQLPIAAFRAQGRLGSSVPIADVSRCSKLSQLFDNLVGAYEQRRRHVEAERLGRLQIDYKFVFRRRLHWKSGRIVAAHDLPGLLAWQIILIVAQPGRKRDTRRRENRPLLDRLSRITSAASSYEIVNSGTFCLKASARASLMGKTYV